MIMIVCVCLIHYEHYRWFGKNINIIEGLSSSGEYYTEAIECLQSRFERPRLIHQAHVRKILEASNLKDGTGKELHRFEL